jgi:hypothetical protein
LMVTKSVSASLPGSIYTRLHLNPTPGPEARHPSTQPNDRKIVSALQPALTMDSLNSLLTNLQLQPINQSPATKQFNTFTLFPDLPTELRLKILSHALPNHTTLRLVAYIAVTDPSFGLYLTFAPATMTNPIESLFMKVLIALNFAVLWLHPRSY